MGAGGWAHWPPHFNHCCQPSQSSSATMVRRWTLWHEAARRRSSLKQCMAHADSSSTQPEHLVSRQMFDNIVDCVPTVELYFYRHSSRAFIQWIENENSYL